MTSSERQQLTDSSDMHETYGSASAEGPEKPVPVTTRRRKWMPKTLRILTKRIKMECCEEEGNKYRMPSFLAVLTVSYCAFGAVVFHWIENDKPNYIDHHAVRLISQIASQLRPGCQENLQEIIGASGNYSNGNASAGRMGPNDNSWHYGSAFLFTFSIVTTIGYGNVSPQTITGRVFCLIYSIVGIPLSYLGIAVVGRLLSEIMLGIYIRWRVWSRFRLPRFVSGELTEIPIKLPLRVIVAIFVTWIAIGSFMLPYWERLSVFDSCYFIIISLTTIGLGDIYPGEYNYFAITYIYLTMGLVVTTMLIDSLADYLRRIQYVGRVIKDFGSQYVHFGGDEMQVGKLISEVLRQLPMSEDEKAVALMHVEQMIRNAVKKSSGKGKKKNVYAKFPWYGAVQPEALEYLGLKVGNIRPMEEEWFNSWSNYNTWLREVYNVDSKGLSVSSREQSNLTSEATRVPSRSDILSRSSSRMSRIHSMIPIVREKSVRF